MKYRLLCVLISLAIVTVASAQTKRSFSGKCAKPDIMQSVPAGDNAGHMFMIAQGKCTVETGQEIAGLKSKEGAFSEHSEASGTHTKTWGVYVETLDNGDKIFYSYQGSGTTKDGAPVAMNDKWQVTGGTGKIKGAKGMGSCKLTGNAGGGVDYACTGEYTLPAM